MNEDLNSYFENNKGTGILATADGDGKVDAAVYARPHFLEDGTVAMIMRDRLTHANIQSNPHAAYLFIEAGPGYKGKRLFLTKVREEEESELLYELKRKDRSPREDAKKGDKFLVIFKVDKVLPLIGSGE
ncbi:MAG: pyridoxamine 5'-phosphate oxidase family protein [Thermodesulfobacteriota bacterium]